MRVDDEFHKLWKKSGYSSPVFTRKLVDELFCAEEKKRKKNDGGWMFKI